MSDRFFTCLLLAGALVLPRASAQEAVDPTALLARADRVREVWPQAVLRLAVTVTVPGRDTVTGELEVAVKGADRMLVRFLDPAQAGRAFVARGGDAWMVFPDTAHPVKVPRSQRLLGGLAAADLLRVPLVEEYEPRFERAETLDGRACAVLRLTARAGHRPAFPVVRAWVDPAEGLLRKAVFLLPSGRTAREVSFDTYRSFAGHLQLARLTVVDTVKPGTSLVEVRDCQAQELPDSLFDPNTHLGGRS